MFFLEIGEKKVADFKSKSSEEVVHGEWHFMIECAFWRFDGPNGAIVGSEDDQAEIDRQFQMFNLGLVESADAFLPSHDLLIKFSSGAQLKSFSAMVSKDYCDWTLYCPDDRCWVAGSGGRLSHRNVHEAE
jgi:hypothetical protein